MLLYIIRHGDPLYNPDSLTEKGRQQAEALGRRLTVHGLDQVFCSPMIRAQQTAAPACRLLGLTPEILDWTSEDLAWKEFTITENDRRTWCFNLQNTSYKTAGVLALGQNWFEAEPFCRTNAREGFQRIQKASDEFLARLGYRRNGPIYHAEQPSEQRVAVFCHQGFGSVWLSQLLAIPTPLFWSAFRLNHSSVTILHFRNYPDGRTAPVCINFSDVSHLYAEKLPLQFCNELEI